MNSDEARLKRLDSAGMLASTLCGIHCALMPLLIGTLTAAGISWIKNEALEWAILAISLCIGLFGLLPSYRRVHRRRSCLWLFWLGALGILGGRLVHTSRIPDTPFVVAGAALIVSAHALNRHLCARCGICSRPDVDSVGRTG
jgi:MerC mercury resistance protein